MRPYRLTPTRIETHRTPSLESVTILVPVLNESMRIAACLAGLPAQTEEVKEIIVVDGGSTDGTQSIVEQFRRKDPCTPA